MSVKAGVNDAAVGIPKPSKVLSTRLGYRLLRPFLPEHTAELYGLLQQLRHGSEWTARGAAFAVGSLKDFRAFYPLVESLRADKRPAVRADVVQVLVGLSEKAPEHVVKAVEANIISAALHDEDKSVRIGALKALAGFKSEEAAGTLLRALERKGLEQAYAAQSLGEMAQALRGQLEAAVGVADKENTEKALKLIEEKASPVLLEILVGENEVYARVYAANALICIGKPLGEEAEGRVLGMLENEADPRARAGAIAVLAALGGLDSLEAIRALAERGENVGPALAEITRRLGAGAHLFIRGKHNT